MVRFLLVYGCYNSLNGRASRLKYFFRSYELDCVWIYRRRDPEEMTRKLQSLAKKRYNEKTAADLRKKRRKDLFRIKVEPHGDQIQAFLRGSPSQSTPQQQQKGQKASNRRRDRNDYGRKRTSTLDYEDSDDDDFSEEDGSDESDSE